MVSTPTTRGGYEKQNPGENEDTWGGNLNTNVIDLVDQGIHGVATVQVAGNMSLTSTNYVPNQVRNRVLRFVPNGLTAAATITIPAVQNWWNAHNVTAYPLIFDAGNETVTVPPGRMCMVYCNGTDCFLYDPTVDAANYAAAASESADAAEQSAMEAASSAASVDGDGLSARIWFIGNS